VTDLDASAASRRVNRPVSMLMRGTGAHEAYQVRENIAAYYCSAPMTADTKIAPAPFTYEYTTHSIEELRALFATDPSPRQIQSLGSSFDYSLSTTEYAGFTAGRFASNSGLDVVRRAPRGGYFIVLPSSGLLRFDLPKSAIDADTRHVAVMDDLAPDRTRYSRSLQMEYLHVETSVLRAKFSEALSTAPRKRIEFKANLEARDPTAVSVGHLTRALLDGARGNAPLLRSPLALHNICMAIAQIMVTGLPHNYSEALVTGKAGRLVPRQVRRAMDFMRAHAAQAISMSDIAAAASTSPRTLQDGFQRFCNVTPMEFLREIRLQGVRSDLQNPAKASSISEIAHQWGFFHLGMFAARYKKRFGELPRETVRQLR
jgi:AraC-like DNA-binding protein